MQTIKITAKRQATLPINLCRDMGIRAGDRLILDQRYIDGEVLWVIRFNLDKFSWMGALKRYAQNKSHHMGDIRRSIANAGRE